MVRVVIKHDADCLMPDGTCKYLNPKNEVGLDLLTWEGEGGSLDVEVEEQPQ